MRYCTTDDRFFIDRSVSDNLSESQSEYFLNFRRSPPLFRGLSAEKRHEGPYYRWWFNEGSPNPLAATRYLPSAALHLWSNCYKRSGRPRSKLTNY